MNKRKYVPTNASEILYKKLIRTLNDHYKLIRTLNDHYKHLECSSIKPENMNERIKKE